MVNFAFDAPYFHSARAEYERERYHVRFEGIDAGIIFQREVIMLTERELLEFNQHEMDLLERMISEPPTGVDLRAYREDWSEARVMIEMIPRTPCVTTLEGED